MEKKLLETKTLKEIRDVIYNDIDFLTGITLVVQDDYPLMKLVCNFPHFTKAIEFYRDRTTTNDLAAAFNDKKNSDLFSLLLTKQTAGIALNSAALNFSYDKVKECLTFPQTQENLNKTIRDISCLYEYGKGPRIDIVKLLLEKGAKFPSDFNIEVVIRNGLYYPVSYALATIILNREEAKDFVQPVKDSALLTALNYDQLSLVEQLLKLEANPENSLDAACYKDDSKAVRLLLRYGANPDQNNSSALRTAVTHNKKENVKALIEYKVDIHAYKDMALRTASEQGFYDIVELLLKAGAKVSAENQSAIRYASKNGHLQVVKLLLEYGANPRVKNNQALEWAKNRRHIDVANLLEEWIQKQESEKNKN